MDAGFDAGPDDAGFDAGSDDAGFDAGSNDAGFDAGPDDAGFDAGPDDAGFDAGSMDAGFDAGPDDAGFDAGPNDAGFDAGLPPDPVCIGGDDEVEEEPVPDVLVTTLADVVDDSDGVLSLREALGQLEDGTLAPGVVIGFASGLSGPLTLSSALDVEKSFTLVGHDENGDGVPDIVLEHPTTSGLLLSAYSASYRFRHLGFVGAQVSIGLDAHRHASLVIERCAFLRVDGVESLGAVVAAPWFATVIPYDTSYVIRDSYFERAVSLQAFDHPLGADGAPVGTATIERTVFDVSAPVQGLSLGDVRGATIANTIVHGATTQPLVRLTRVTDARFVNTTIVGTNAVPRLRHRSSTIALENTVLSGPGADCAIHIEGDAISASHSFIGATDGCTFTGSGNITGTVAAPADARLLPLGAHGGARKSALPAPDSPLIDSGDDARATVDDAPLGSDVRGLGFPRLCDGDDDGVYTVDIGATEFKPEE